MVLAAPTVDFDCQVSSARHPARSSLACGLVYGSPSEALIRDRLMREFNERFAECQEEFEDPEASSRLDVTVVRRLGAEIAAAHAKRELQARGMPLHIGVSEALDGGIRVIVKAKFGVPTYYLIRDNRIFLDGE